MYFKLVDIFNSSALFFYRELIFYVINDERFQKFEFENFTLFYPWNFHEINGFNSTFRKIIC